LTFERLVKKLTNQGDPNPAEVVRGEVQFHKFAKVLNAHLTGRKWLVGNDLTIADFAVGAPMVTAEPAEYPVGQYSEINRWYGAIAALPAWKKALATTA